MRYLGSPQRQPVFATTYIWLSTIIEMPQARQVDHHYTLEFLLERGVESESEVGHGRAIYLILGN